MAKRAVKKDLNKVYKIKKDDHVMVVSGKEKGKSSQVTSVNSKRGTVTLEKLNIVKRHTKPDGQVGAGRYYR